MLDAFNQYGFLIFFLVALILASVPSTNRWFALGVASLGLPGLLFLLLRDEFERSELFELTTATRLAAYGLLLVGAFLMLKRQQVSASRGVEPTSLGSLVIPRNDTNTHTRAEVLRDQLSERFRKLQEGAAFAIHSYKSPPQNGTVWFTVDYAIPSPSSETSLRARLTVTVQRFDFHRFEHLYDLDVSVGNQRKRYLAVIQLSDAELQAIHRYMTGEATLGIHPSRVRTFPFQLWRPRNKSGRVRPDWAPTVLVTLSAAALAIPLIGILLFAAGMVAFWLWRRKRNIRVLTTGKPLKDPRTLYALDSWQANVLGLGPRADEVRERVNTALKLTPNEEVSVTIERISYRGIDGIVERDQLVLAYRRALAFVHIYGYGEDLYVGWDSHLNAGTWFEETLLSGVDRLTGRLVTANRVSAGYQQLNEYDVTDGAFLTEWLHAHLSRVVRLEMEERKIDQEVDFTVHRGSRRDAVSAGGPGGEQKAKEGGRLFPRLMRRA